MSGRRIMFYVFIMTHGLQLVQSGAPLPGQLDPEGTVQCGPEVGVGMGVQTWQWAGRWQECQVTVSRLLGSLQIYVCLNIEKRQEKRGGAKEKRVDKPRTPKNPPTIKSI